MKICLVLHKYGIPLDDPCCYPLGFMYISSVLKAAAHEVKVLNYNLWDYDLREELKGMDCAAFTGFEEFFPYIQRDAAIAKEMGIHTVVGGALATFLPQVMIRHADSVVMGEGELVLNQALLSFGGFTGRPPDLARLPLPDYEGFGIEEYNRRHNHRYMGVLTSRGCPNNCSFCAHICTFAVRPLDHVFVEIDYYRGKYGVEDFVFNDNTLNLNKDRFLALCDGMRARGTWGGAIRVDVFDEEMARAAKGGGCKYFVVGVESFLQKKLDRMKKGIRVEQIRRTLDLLHEYQIDYHGNILFGLDGETIGEITRELSDLPREYNIFPVMVEPFVGTKEGTKRGISEGVCASLRKRFSEYAVSRGKYCYPALEAI